MSDNKHIIAGPPRESTTDGPPQERPPSTTDGPPQERPPSTTDGAVGAVGQTQTENVFIPGLLTPSPRFIPGLLRPSPILAPRAPVATVPVPVPARAPSPNLAGGYAVFVRHSAQAAGWQRCDLGALSYDVAASVAKLVRPYVALSGVGPRNAASPTGIF